MNKENPNYHAYIRIRAFAAHKVTQAPHWTQAEKFTVTRSPGTTVLTPWEQTFSHIPHPVHFSRFTASWGLAASPKGLLHHRQRKGHPLKNRMVRMPGPSALRKRPMSNKMAVFSLMLRPPQDSSFPEPNDSGNCIRRKIRRYAPCG